MPKFIELVVNNQMFDFDVFVTIVVYCIHVQYV